MILRGCVKVIDRSPDIIIIVSFDNDPVSSEAQAELKRFEAKGFKFYVADEEEKLIHLNLEKLLKQKNSILIITKKKL